MRALRAEGVKTDFIVRGGDRIGIYFAEAGASQRASNVIYDRARSAISELEPGTLDWQKIFHRRRLVPRDGHHAGAGREAVPPPRARRSKPRRKPARKCPST